MGYRCGYVGLPKEHCLYGKTYDDYLDIKKSDIEEKIKDLNEQIRNIILKKEEA